MGLFKKGNKNSPAGQQDPKARADRLLEEYNRIFECFRSHPYISVQEVFGTPPEKYHFLYRVDGLVHSGKSLESKNEHVVEITLPANYPAKDPVCRALTPIYHPNISPEIIDIKRLLNVGISLADLVVRIGELIVFQRYSIDEPLNVEASQWAARNKSILPLSSVNLNYALPQAPPDTVPVVDQPTGAVEASDSAPAIHEQKTESIIIENDSAKIKLDQETLPAEDEKRTEAILVERETPPDLQEPVIQTLAENAGAPENQKQGRPIGNQGPLSYHDKKTEFISKHDFFCPSCGNKNSKKANFCIHCGTRLTRQSALKNARTFFLASMIAVPVIIIGAGIGAIVLRNANVDFLKVPLFHFPSSAQKEAQEKSVEAAPNRDSAVENLPPKEAPQEAEMPSREGEKALTPDKLSSVKKSNDIISKQKPIRESLEPVKNRKSKVEAVSELPARSKKTVEKSQADNAAARTPMPKAGNEQQKSEKIANSLKLAKLYAGIGSYDDAITQYLDVLMLDPTNQEAREGLVKARETKKNTLGK
ncbi:MAG: zinc-ribbon domain-containing protein [Chitinivibrionales bacterium]